MRNFGASPGAPQAGNPDPPASKAVPARPAALLSVTATHIQVVDSIADL
jgi:hypothetical protein